MNAGFPVLPEISCQYEHYDPQTLRPTNESTYVRLIETGWNADTFKAKSVLDIGCNSGILSLFAHDLGASSVKGVDVMDPFVDFFSQVVKQHKLPIKVEKKPFWKLDVKTDAADVVLCMEVLHWIVQQGGLLPDAIAHLAALTGETLFVETPWDVDEPSIASRQNYPTENYDIETITRELARHFSDVRIERFMTYFGNMPGSKRVLIKATGKRASSLAVRHIRDANLTGISMSRGTNQMELLSTTMGVKTLKRMPRNSAFVLLDEETVDLLGDFLNYGCEDSPIVAPEILGGSYRSSEADGETYMLFPFVGDLGNYFPKPKVTFPVDQSMELALGVFRHLAHAPSELVTVLKPRFGRLRSVEYHQLPDPVANRLADEGLGGFLDGVAQRMKGYDQALEDALIHNDMQGGNMVKSPDGRVWVVDIDLMRAGPAYADIFSCAIHTGVNADSLNRTLKEAARIGPRKPTDFDRAFSVSSVLLWFQAFLKVRGEVSDAVLNRYVGSLKMVAKLDL